MPQESFETSVPTADVPQIVSKFTSPRRLNEIHYLQFTRILSVSSYVSN